LTEEAKTIKRCKWAEKSELDRLYHDNEWGTPLHDDMRLFELLILECFQPGLSWSTVLAKRESMRAAFDGFDPEIMASYGDEKLEELMANPNIIRNRRKIEAAAANAAAFLKVRRIYGSFDSFIWSYTDFKQIREKRNAGEKAPPKSKLSEKISRDMKELGFKFTGPVVVYSFMQAAGLVNDHEPECFLYDR
jgi:DNA-3-methyladenine glycosylase I